MPLALAGLAQTGSVNIHDHAGANELIEQHIYFNKEHSQIPGWRIQVFSSPSMSEANSQKSAVLNNLSNIKTTIVFEAPNYKVRIGNYRNRFDAYRDLQEILIYYPSAFICKDLINVKEI
jgi:hypothetical protein